MSSVILVNAGIDQIINLPISSVTLTALSTTPKSIVTKIIWRQIFGDPAGIISSNKLSTLVNNIPVGRNVFQIEITDNFGSVAMDNIAITVINYKTYPRTWVRDFSTYICDSGQVSIQHLLKVSNDINYYPLDIFDNRVDQTGLPQATKPNVPSDSNYVTPYTDNSLCT